MTGIANIQPWRDAWRSSEVHHYDVTADPRAGRNLGLLLAGAGCWILITVAVSWSRYVKASPFKATGALSLGVTLLGLGAACIWGYAYQRRHSDEPVEYWRALQARFRSRLVAATYAVTLLSAGIFIVAWIASLPEVAGTVSAPAAFGAILSIGNLTGGIRPL